MGRELPNYVNQHFLSDEEAISETKRVQKRVIEALRILSQIDVNGIKEIITHPISYKQVRINLRDDIELTRNFLNSVEALQMVHNQAEKVKMYMQAISDLDLLEMYFYRYNTSAEPMYKNLMFKLTEPYYSVMKATIAKCKDIFQEEEDNLYGLPRGLLEVE